MLYNVVTSDHIKEGWLVKHMGVRQFRDRATAVLREGEPIAVERHGKLIGIYIPVEEERGDDKEELRLALSRLEERVTEIAREAGLSEEELADAFDLTRRGSG